MELSMLGVKNWKLGWEVGNGEWFWGAPTMQLVAGWGMSSWSAGVWDNNRGSEDNIGNNGSSSSSKGRGVDSLTVAMIALGLGEGSLGQITGSTASNGGRVVKNRQAEKQNGREESKNASSRNGPAKQASRSALIFPAGHWGVSPPSCHIPWVTSGQHDSLRIESCLRRGFGGEKREASLYKRHCSSERGARCPPRDSHFPS